MQAYGKDDKGMRYHQENQLPLLKVRFATLALSKGMPIKSVSRILGHTNIDTSQTYAKITVQKMDCDLTMLGDKRSKSFGNVKMAGI